MSRFGIGASLRVVWLLVVFFRATVPISRVECLTCLSYPFLGWLKLELGDAVLECDQSHWARHVVNAPIVRVILCESSLCWKNVSVTFVIGVPRLMWVSKLMVAICGSRAERVSSGSYSSTLYIVTRIYLDALESMNAQTEAVRVERVGDIQWCHVSELKFRSFQIFQNHVWNWLFIYPFPICLSIFYGL